MKSNVFKLIFIIWVSLWVFFIIRGLTAQGVIYDYRELLLRPLEGKHSYVTGDSLYEFLIFCKNKLPEGAKYKIIGLDEGSLEKRRAVYYLYPLIESETPEFILNYGPDRKAWKVEKGAK